MQQTQNLQPIEAIHCADNDLTEKKRRDYKRKILEQHYQFDIGSVLLDDLLYVKRIHNFLIITTTTKGTITDKGDEIYSKDLAPEDSAKKIIALAKMKGWHAITLTGSDLFLESAMIEAIKNGIEVNPANEHQRKLLEEAKRKYRLELEALTNEVNSKQITHISTEDIGIKLHNFRNMRNTEDLKQVIIKPPRAGF